MVKNTFTTVLRVLRRQRGYAFITVGGLALAMAVCILTVSWAQYEFSFDKFHKKGRDIYRFIVDERREQLYCYPGSPISLGSVMEQSLPEVRQAVRVSIRWGDRVESAKTADFGKIRYCMADPAFLTLFDFPLVQGDTRTALDNADSVVLSESAARRFFGTADPIGQTLFFLDKRIPAKVTGIMKDVPKTSHLQFDILIPIKTVDVWYSENLPKNFWNDWTYNSFPLYVQLAPGADPKAVEAKVGGIVKAYNPKADYKLWLQPLFQAHLWTDGFRAMGLANTVPLDIGQVRLFLLVSFIILLMAAINYTNLATARALKRTREIGVRKANGASRADIVRQFLGESVFLAFLALACALVLSVLLFPLFKTVSGREVDPALVPKVPLALSLLGLTLLTGLVSGLYPALFSASFAPVRALKEKFRSGRGSSLGLRRGLVAVQIIASASLVVVVSVILLQIRYIKAKDLGYDPRNILVMPFPDEDRVEAFKNELTRQPGVLGATDGLLPTLGPQGHRDDGSRISWEGKSEGANVPMDFMFVDENYLKTYGMRMAEGRFFSKDLPSDKKNFVVNEAAVRAMNLQDPVGKAFAMGNRKGSIIGVLKDFHLGTLRSKIGPAVFVCSSFSQLSIRLDPRNTRETIGRVEAVWRSFIKDKPFEYHFLEELLDGMYKADRDAARLISVFGILSLIISSLGLFGLTSFMAEQRTKEIGIRKVLGATIPAIVRLMSREFAALVGLAVVVAVPAAYYASSRWLGSFAYRIDLAWWIFAGSGAAVTLITLLTVAWPSFRAAVVNPVESLRYE